MPKRIPFHIVYATSEDPVYPACELNTQGPGARGWRSAAAARPPHELLLRLGCVASLQRLQLLAHHQLVPASVEVLVSGGVVTEGAATPCGAAYTAVGRVSLARPEPQARSRELRSAALGEPTTARFVKLRLSAPHSPSREDDQVALMAVNVIGDEVEETPSPSVAKELLFSPYDDLAFVMYVDNEIADVVRRLDARKQAAVAEERFEYARRLKSASSALVSAGSRVGRWRLRKRMAAAREDFELARHMRDRISDAVAGIKEDVLLCRLMEDDGPDPRNDSSMHQEYDFSHHLSPSVVSACLSLDIPSPVPPDTGRQDNELGRQENVLGRQENDLGRQENDLGCSNNVGGHGNDAGYQDDDFRHQGNELGALEGQEIEYNDQENELVQDGEEVDNGIHSHVQAKTDSFQERRPSEDSLSHEYKLREQVIENKIEEQKRKEQKILEEHRILEEKKLEEHRILNENRIEDSKSESLNTDSSYTHRNEEEHNVLQGNRDEELKREHKRLEESNNVELQRNLGSKEDISRVDDKIVVQTRFDLKMEEESKRETDSPRRSVTPNAANGSLVRRRNKSAGPRSTFEAHEESILPALRHSHTNEYLRGAREEEYSAGSASSIPQRAPHKLNERERKHAALPILIFGYPLVEKFYSKNFIDKEEGLARLRSELTTPSGGSTKTSPNKTARAAALLLQRALRDKVYSVYSQANETVKVLFQQFVPDRVCAAEVQRCVEKLLPELLRACGDPAPRVHATAQHTVLTVADCSHVRSLHYIPQQLVRPVPASMHPRLALSRLQMLEQLILTHGISSDKNSGLTVRRLAECGASGAQHAAGSVRAAAERILLAAYERSPRIVRAQLPPDDAVTRRNLIYRHLFQQFDRIDMQKMLNQAPTEQELDQSQADSILETASLSQSTRSTGMTSSLLTSLAATSSYSLKSMASSASGTPSSLNSYSTKSKSSLKKSPTKKYSPSLPKSRDFSNSLGYNKLRLDSAVSPKHSPRTGGVEKVHFQEPQSEVVYRRKISHHPEHRHSMIHYDHETSKPTLKERPTTVYEPLQIDYTDYGSPRTSKHDLRDHDFRDIELDSSRNYRGSKTSVNDLKDLDLRNTSLDSPRMYRGSQKTPTNDLKNDPRDLDFRDTSDSPRLYRGSPKTPVNDLKTDPRLQDGQRGRFDLDRSLDSPKSYFHGGLESPKLVAGVRNLQLNMDEGCQMDESGYYSPGRRQQVDNQMFESYEAGEASCDSTPEPCLTPCPWCGRRVRPSALESHYWRRCVVLARCPHCRLTVEARALHVHLLEECSMSEGAWKQCHQCGAALRIDDKGYHNCIPLSLDEWKCPYCLTNVLARDLPWQRHLIQCPRNPRLTNTPL